MNFWQPGFWALGFWAPGFWQEQPPEVEPPIASAPGAQAAHSYRRSRSTKRVGLWVDGVPVWVDADHHIQQAAKRKARQRREAELLLLGV